MRAIECPTIVCSATATERIRLRRATMVVHIEAASSPCGPSGTLSRASPPPTRWMTTRLARRFAKRTGWGLRAVRINASHLDGLPDGFEPQRSAPRCDGSSDVIGSPGGIWAPTISGFPDRPRGRRPPCRSCGGGRAAKGRPRAPGMPAPKINLISIGCGRACPPGPAPCPPAPHPNNGRRPMIVRSIIAICVVTLFERLDRGRLGQRSAQSRQGSCSTPANAVFDFYRSSLAQSSVSHADDRAVIWAATKGHHGGRGGRGNGQPVPTTLYSRTLFGLRTMKRFVGRNPAFRARRGRHARGCRRRNE